MTKTIEKVIIPANVYDAHELVTLMRGGVGRGDLGILPNEPCCLVGQGFFLVGEHNVAKLFIFRDTHHIPALFYDARENDVVFRMNEWWLTWKEYCKRRHIVRGK